MNDPALSASPNFKHVTSVGSLGDSLMSRQPSDRDRDEAVEYDNWPVEGKSQRDLKWLGFVGGTGAQGAPALYEPHRNTIYQGTIDEKNERIVPNPETERRVSDNETIGEVLQDIADSHGWQSLSNFAAEHLGSDEDEQEIDTDREEVLPRTTFHQRNVAISADHQIGFFGSTTYEDEEGVQTIEHEFHVYTQTSHREDSKPTAEIEEDRLVTETVEEAMQGTDAELVEEDNYEIVLDIDPELQGRREEAVIEEYCEEWHENTVRS